MSILPCEKGLVGFQERHPQQHAGIVAMHFSRSPCPSQSVRLPRDFRLPDALPLHVCLPCTFSLHGSVILKASPLSVRRNFETEDYQRKLGKQAIGSLQICFASTQSPKHSGAATEKSFWPSILPRPLIYSFDLSDVDPDQLSELWLQTLRVKRDPKKIVKALRHSFAFVVVLAEDENASSTSSSRLKTVGVGRAVSDGSFIATICDVAVDPAYRRRGIGRRIVKKLVENMKKIGGPSGFVVFPPPLARRFFWMIGFRSDRKYKLMAYRGTGDKLMGPNDMKSSGKGSRLVETEEMMGLNSGVELPDLDSLGNK